MSNYAIPWLIIIVKSFLILFVTLTLAAYMVLAERKLLARMQNRYGPNRVGPFGLLQPLADVIKLITKEDILPDQADKFIYFIAPGVVAGTVLLTFAVVPFGAPVTVNGTTVGMPVIDLNVGTLYFLAMSSLGVYGVALAGWSSGSKYSLLGGIRGSAQMISYELSMGLSLVPVVMLTGSFSLNDIVAAQSQRPIRRLFPPRLYNIPGERRGGVQEDTVRPGRGRERAGRGLPYRVQRDALRPFFHRRVREYHRPIRARRHLLPGRMARPRPRVAFRILVLPEGGGDSVLLHLDAGDPPKAPLRPAHAPGLEVPCAALSLKRPSYRLSGANV